MNNLKIAFVKSSIYQDLWACDITSDVFKIFQTSLMRCPPIGLHELVHTDFIIVKESQEYPCQVNPNCLTHAYRDNLKFSKELKIPDLPLLDETYHKDLSIDSISYHVDNIYWNKYNIVIIINACIPNRRISKFPSVLWCYYIGENEEFRMNYLLGKYDVLLNQDVNKQNLPHFSIGFPYTLLGPRTLENLHLFKLKTPALGAVMSKVSDADCNDVSTRNEKRGIFIEINNTQERPVKTIPDSFQQISDHCNIPLYIHNQNIIENLKTLHSCSYFIKIYGRIIRGNSVLEAISCGTLVLINKNLVMYSDLIPNECHVETPEDIINKINYFEKNKEIYNSMLELQRKILEEKYYKEPISNLCYKYKIKNTQ